MSRDLIRADSTILEISVSGSSIYMEIDQDRSFLELTETEAWEIVKSLIGAIYQTTGAKSNDQ